MTPFIGTLLGIAGGLFLLALVFLVSFRRKPSERQHAVSAENYDVFQKDPSFYSSQDDHKD